MKKVPLSECFWAKVDKQGPTMKPELGPCWPWVGANDGLAGYGILTVKRKHVRATHVAIYLATGKWPISFALHKCDYPPCVRFEHLFEGTHQVNAEDRERKGRGNGGKQLAHKMTAKTHCPQGHPYSGDNLLPNNQGYRLCRECNRIKCQKRREQ